MPTAAQISRINRDRKIIAKAHAGMPYVDIATEYGLTFQRVWQICKDAGLAVVQGKRNRSRGNVSPKPVKSCPPGTKDCTNCGIVKPFSEFSKSSRDADGLQDNCKACNRKISAAYRAANPEKERERHRKYQAENPDKRTAIQTRWRKNNPEKARASSRRFYVNNRTKERARHQAYVAANIERLRIWRSKHRAENISRIKNYEREYIKRNRAKVNAKNVRRKTRLMQALVSWANHEKIADFYQEAQRLTKETGIEHHVDHIVPLQSNIVCGLHVENNLQVITGVMNSKKNNKLSV